MVRWSDLISSVRHPRSGKCAKRREPYGRIGICEDLRHLRTASDCEQAHRQPWDQGFAVHLVLPSYACCVKLNAPVSRHNPHYLTGIVQNGNAPETAFSDRPRHPISCILNLMVGHHIVHELLSLSVAKSWGAIMYLTSRIISASYSGILASLLNPLSRI